MMRRLQRSILKKFDFFSYQDPPGNEGLYAPMAAAYYRTFLKKSTSFEDKPWYHGCIGREEAEQRLIDSGLHDGTYLIRTKDNHYVISQCYKNFINHYFISFDQLKKEYCIPGGQSFSSLNELVHCYQRKKEGLMCTLRYPCKKPLNPSYSNGFNNNRQSPVNINSSIPSGASSPVTILPPAIASRTPSSGHITQSSSFSGSCGSPELPKHFTPISKAQPPRFNPSHSITSARMPECPENMSLEMVETLHRHMTTPQHSANATPRVTPTVTPLHQACLRRNSQLSMSNYSTESRRALDYRQSPSRYVPVEHYSESVMSTPTNSRLSRTPLPRTPLIQTPINSPSHYKTSKFHTKQHSLDHCDLFLYYQIGQGNFGVVMHGVLRREDGKERTVAVKILKTDSQCVTNDKDQMLWEAKIMSELDHPNVIRLIGVFNGPPLMLVSELAPVGQLNKFLRRNPDTPVEMLMNYVHQLAYGMEYLEKKNFVHRDLAARNVLLVTERHIKISDFGMSRMIGVNKDYYRANSGGQWPIRWYAPECVYFFKFTHKSDVWSFGITVWEIFSFGKRPYGSFTSAEILDFLERGDRLKRPPACPHELNSLMLRCWEYTEDYRPTFDEIKQVVDVYYRAMASGGINFPSYSRELTNF